MPEIIRALIVVIVLGFFAFHLGRWVATGNISPREFGIWRNLWFVATAAGFLSGNLYVYALVLAMLVLYAHAERALGPPVYLLLLFVVPPVHATIGGMEMVNKLIDIDNPTLLGAFILLPIFFSAASAAKQIRNAPGRVLPDLLIVCYVLLITVLQLRSSSTTNAMRVMLEYTFTILLPYFVFSRAVTTIAETKKVLVTFVIAALPLCLIAVFETIKGWHLYDPIINEWGGLQLSPYLERSGILRATASAMQPIPLGFVLMVALGCLLALQQTALNRNAVRLCLVIFCAGLAASFSRGPWVGAVVLMLVYMATSPKAVTKLGKFALIVIICSGPLLISPIGAPLLDYVPFIGSGDAESIAYRQRLFTDSLIVVERYPQFGSADPTSEPEMQELIQGEGIIDLVNTYLVVVLNFGFVGLTLFVGFFASILLALRQALRSVATTDPELRNLLRASIATLVAILVTIGTVSSISYISEVYWSFAGICVAVTRIAYAQRLAVVYFEQSRPKAVSLELL